MEGLKGAKRVIGILAHVDSGKTTLAEALLFEAGALRSRGRVDHGDAFLDTGAMERQRGITIFSKIARLSLGEAEGILLDTPGHTDFAPEMERALSVLDYCILVVNGADGVTAQTKKLWELLDYYDVPVFLFVNKLDQAGTDRAALYGALQGELSPHIQDFEQADLLKSEDLAGLSDGLLEEYLSRGQLEEDSVREAIVCRDVFPCFFGSALKGEGIARLYDGLRRWTLTLDYPTEFSARVFKISRDEAGRRLTHLKITGGSLANKTQLGEDKINEIRLYSGEGYRSVQAVEAGEVCAVTGLKATRAGQGLGEEAGGLSPTQLPVLSYRVSPGDGDSARLLQLLRQIEEELPELAVTFVEETGQIFVNIMGEVLLEVLTDLLARRGAPAITVDEGSIIYRETVTRPVIGIGHFEPLRHYAEVQLLLEPGDDPEVEAVTACDETTLAGSWQNLILAHILEKTHKGPLLGAPLAKVRITLLAGRAHLKHTVGGDFREATYRAIRQGLLVARAGGASAVLEPYYEFEISTPVETSGRILNDLARLSASSVTASPAGQETLIRGRGPVATLRSYAREVAAITRGQGQIRFSSGGYDLCHDEAAVLSGAAYDALGDLSAPSGSIFTRAGAGVFVPWDEVYAAAHIPPRELGTRPAINSPVIFPGRPATGGIDPAEVDRILGAVSGANANPKKKWKGQRRTRPERTPPRGTPLADPARPTWLLVDGYNVIHAWPELKDLAAVSFDGAREKLREILEDYQGYTGEQVVLVFDAYKVAGGAGSQTHRNGLFVIYTKENETADRYIERRTRELAGTFGVKVVTSDAAEQLSAFGSGALVYSARRFREIIRETARLGQADYERSQGPAQHLRPFAGLFPEAGGEPRQTDEEEVDGTGPANP